MVYQSIGSSAGGWLATYSLPRILYEITISAVSYPFQQIRASDIWRESEHEDLQHCLLDYHIKVTMRGTVFDPPTFKFEGSTDDSMMDINLWIGYGGMNEFIQIIITCARKQTLFVVVGGTM